MNPEPHEVPAVPARRALAARPLLTAAALITAAIVAYLAVAGSPFEAHRREHLAGQGPLQSHTQQGASSMYAPKRAPWTGTFGSYVLCSTTGSVIEIEDIRYHTTVKPLDVHLMLRTVSGKTRAADPAVGPLGGAIGEPPDLPDGRLPGRFEKAGPGTRITQSCADEDRSTSGFTELLFAMKVGEPGGIIDRAWIDYRTNDHLYTLKLEWEMIACGMAAAHAAGPEKCNGTANPPTASGS
ncbi:hypothetical protein [Streptomyces sp. RKND-216]|uniref:hypothetical protein n=1 Tax=Streptomyces sp. RKND-216 TaxID=2562581 RepID=UPI001FF80CCE|nr:hypothetical protein [Streptomyces sp. RKND-216]